MYIDSFTKSLTLGDDDALGGFGMKGISQKARATVLASVKKARAVRRPGSVCSGHTLANKGIKMRGIQPTSGLTYNPAMARAQGFSGDALGFDYLMSNPSVYLRGDEYVDGWLTNITKPVSKVVRSVSSSALGLTRTGVRAAAPAVISALTGRPVSVSPSEAAASGAYMAPPKDNTMLYVGLGGAALIAMFAFSNRGSKR